MDSLCINLWLYLVVICCWDEFILAVLLGQMLYATRWLSKGCPQIYSYSIWEYIGVTILLLLLKVYNLKIFVNLIVLHQWCNYWFFGNHGNFCNFILPSLISCKHFFLYLLALCLLQNFNFLWAGVHLFGVSTPVQHLFNVGKFKLLQKQFCHWG